MEHDCIEKHDFPIEWKMKRNMSLKKRIVIRGVGGDSQKLGRKDLNSNFSAPNALKILKKNQGV